MAFGFQPPNPRPAPTTSQVTPQPSKFSPLLNLNSERLKLDQQQDLTKILERVLSTNPKLNKESQAKDWLDRLSDILVSEAHAQEPPPTSDDFLKSTPDANTTDEFIIQKAQELDNDPVKIFEFVRDQIGYESYKGSLRGARGTLWSMAGNALDQASLLIALLRASGIPARYVKGTIEDDLAKQLILSMFPPVCNVIGVIPESTLTSDPANDPELLGETREHFWVEMDTGGGFTPVEPAIKFAKIGEVFAPVSMNFAEVPDNLRHKVTVRLNAELTGALTGLVGLRNDPKTVLNETFNTVELVGKPLSLGHFVNSVTPPALLIGTTTHTYSPYLLIGQNDGDITDDPLIRGEDYQELLTNFPLASQFLTGLFFEMEVLVPGQEPKLFERTLFDRIGLEVRKNGGSPNIVVDGSSGAILTPFDVFSMSIQVSEIDGVIVDSNLVQVEKLEEERDQLLESVDSSNSESPEQAELLNQINSTISSLVIAVTQKEAHSFNEISEDLTRQLANTTLIKSYFSEPRITLVTQKAEVTSNEISSVSFGIDLRKDEIRSVPYPGQSLKAQFGFNVLRGLFEGALEDEIISLLGVSEEEDASFITSVSTVAIVKAAFEQGIPINFFMRGDENTVNALNIPIEAKIRIADAIEKGMAILVPTEEVLVGEGMQIGWFQISPLNGETIAVSQDGGHQALAEFGTIVRKSALISAGKLVLGILGKKFWVTFRTSCKGNASPGSEKDNKCKEIEEQAKREADFVNTFGLSEVLGPVGGTFAKQIVSEPVKQTARSFGEVPKFEPGITAKSPAGRSIQFAEKIVTKAIVGIGLGAIFALISIYLDELLFSDPPIPDTLLSPPGCQFDPGGQTPGVSLEILKDELYTLPFDNVQLPLAFRAQVQNLGPEEDSYVISFPSIPSGFVVQASVPSIPLIPGQVSEVGVYLFPDGPIPAPEISELFSVKLTSNSDQTVFASVTQEFTIPEIPGLSLAPDPVEAFSAPGETSSVFLSLQSTGNVPVNNVELNFDGPPGLALSGLTSPVSLSVGESSTQTLSFTADANTPLNSTLTGTITATFGSLDSPQKVSTQVLVEVVAPGAQAVANAGSAATELGEFDLATTLDSLGTTLTDLAEDPTNELFKSRLLADLDSLIRQLETDPQFSEFIDDLKEAREAIEASTEETFNAALADLGLRLDAVSNILTQLADFQFALSMTPSDIDLQPGESAEFNLRLENLGAEPTDFQLSVGDLPDGVTANLSATEVTVNPGEVLNGTGASPLTLTLDQSIANSVVFPLEVIATPVGADSVLETASSRVTIQQAVADVLNVTLDPVVIMEAGNLLSATAQIFNSANVAQSVTVRAEVLDSIGTAVGTPIDQPMDLNVGGESLDVNFDGIPTTGLVDGLHTLRVSLLNASGFPVSGRMAEAAFYLGTPISAKIHTDLTVVPPGTTNVKTTIEVTNLTELQGSSAAADQLIQFHTADAVATDLSTLDASTGDPADTLGLPNGQTFTLAQHDELVLDLGPAGNHAIDGPGDDLLVEVPDRFDFYDVDVSLDGAQFVPLATRVQGKALLDLSTTSLPEIRYVRLTGQSFFGTVVDSIRVLNSLGGVNVERVDFSVGEEGLNSQFGDFGIVATPIIGNLDADPQSEILFLTNQFNNGTIAERLIAVDGLTGVLQFEVPAASSTFHSVALGDIRNDSPGPEIVFPTGSGRLKLLSATGQELFDVAGGGSGVNQRVMPAIANLDEDPEPEIVARTSNSFDSLGVFNGDGTVSWTSSLNSITSVVVADLNLDTKPEVLATHTFNTLSLIQPPAVSGTTAQGLPLWQTRLGGAFFGIGTPAIADVDGAIGGDLEPEIVVGTNDGLLNILNHDGTVLKKIQIGGTSFGPPAIADINSDGQAEILVSVRLNNGTIFALQLTAAALANPLETIPVADVLLWSNTAEDVTSRTGISVYDLDGDGSWEVIWNGFGPNAGGFRILSGADGSLIYNNPRINSRSVIDYPAIADVDNDGHTELVTGDQEGLWIIGADNLWIDSRNIWNQHSYHITNINDDLTIPIVEPNSWDVHNTYHTQTPPVDPVLGILDLQVHHHLPDNGYVVDTGTITPTANTVLPEEIIWEAERSGADPDEFSFMFSGAVDNMMPGETRDLSLGTELHVTLKDTKGVSGPSATLTLPTVAVTSPHILSLEPPSNVTPQGTEAIFAVHLMNPLPSIQTFTLRTVGLEDLNVNLDQEVVLQPHETITRLLTIGVPFEVPPQTRPFSVVTESGAGAFDSVTGSLTITEVLNVPNVNFDAFLIPTSVVAIPNDPTVFNFLISNTGTEAATYDIAFASLPNGVTGALNQSSITLAPGEGTSPGTEDQTVSLTVTQTGGSLLPFELAMTVTQRGVTGASQTLRSSVVLRDEIVEVVSVTADPGFANPGDMVNVSTRILNTVNQNRDVQVSYAVKDPSGTIIFTSPVQDVALTVQSSLVTVDFGTLDTTGFELGTHQIDVTVSDTDAQLFPGGTGQTTLLLGSPITATMSLDQEVLLPGTSTIKATLEVNSSVDLPDPQISLLGLVDTSGRADSFALKDNLAYVCGNENISVVDIADSENPQVLNVFAEDLIEGSFSSFCRIIDDHLVVLWQTGTGPTELPILVFGLSDPVNPNLVSNTAENWNFLSSFFFKDTFGFGTIQAITFIGTTALSQHGDFLSFNFSDLNNPRVEDVLLDPNDPPAGGSFRSAQAVPVGDHLAYVATTTATGFPGIGAAPTGRLFIVDISKPTDISILDELEIPGTTYSTGIGLQGDQALIAGNTGRVLNPDSDLEFPLIGFVRLASLDISNPENPVLLGSLTTTAKAVGNTIINSLGNGFYSVSGATLDDEPVLLIVDANDPQDLRVTTLPVPSVVRESQVIGNLLYAPSNAGLGIFDIGDVIGTRITSEVQIPKNTGVTIVSDSFNIAPTEIRSGENFDTIVWSRSLNAARNSEMFMWNLQVEDLKAGEVREVIEGATVDFMIPSGDEGQLDLSALSVTSDHILGLTPPERTVQPGEAASYTLTVKNPTNSATTHALGVQGIPGDWVDLAPQVTVPPLSSVDVPLTLRSDLAAPLGGHGFDIHAIEPNVFASSVGIPGDRFAGLAFDGNGILYGITGDGANTPSTLFSLNLNDALPTHLLSLGRGDFGEAIGFNPLDGRMYHASGFSLNNRIFESIDLTQLTTIDIPLSPDDLTSEARALTFWESEGVFLWTDFDDEKLFRVAPDGQVTLVGEMDHRSKGLAFSLGPNPILYSLSRDDDQLRVIDPSSGRTLLQLSISLPGKVISGGNGLATHPVTGALWALLNTNGPNRELVVITPEVADPAIGPRGSVFGTLVLAGAALFPSSDTRGVVLDLTPSQATAGQGTSAFYTARVTNTGNVTDTFNLTALFPPGFTGVFGQPSVEVPPGLTNFREVSFTMTVPFGAPPGNPPIFVTATSSTDSSVQGTDTATLTIVPLGVGVSITPEVGAPDTTFELTVTNTGFIPDSYDLVLGGPLAAFSMLGLSTVTLNPGASQIVPITMPLESAVFPGDLSLIGLATSQTDPAVQASDTAVVTIPEKQGLAAAFDPEMQVLESPGGEAEFLLIVENTGNVEDAYTATISAKSGAISGSMNGLDNQPTQTIETFRLPGHSTGAILLNTNLVEVGIGTVTVTVTSQTDSALGKGPIAMVEVLPPPNEPPVADAGPDQSLTLDDVGTADGSNSHDPDNGPAPLTFEWKLKEKPGTSALTDADITNSAGPIASIIPDVLGEYVFQLTVSDGEDSGLDEAVIRADNRRPISDAGPDQNVNTGSKVMLDGSGSSDPDGDMITFDWTVEWNLAAKPEGSLLSDADVEGRQTPNPFFTPDVDGVYMFQLIVHDKRVASDPDFVEILARTPNVPPNTRAGDDQGAFFGDVVILDGSGSDDPDEGPEPLTHNWSFANVPAESVLTGANLVDSTMAQASFTPDVPGEYVLRLQVSDGEDSTEDTVKIIVTIRNVPPNAKAGEDQVVEFGHEVILSAGSSTDPDNNPEPLSFVWRFVSVPELSSLTNANIVDSETSTPRFTPDVLGAYVLQVEVFDGEDTDTDNVMITIEDPKPVICDVDTDGDIDRIDVNMIFASRGQTATGPDDPRDSTGDGLISINDGRACVLKCTNPRCVP